MARQPTPKVRPFIEGWEDRRRVGYLDVAGIPTAGVGHTGDGVRAGVAYNDATIDRWFTEDIDEAVATIARFVPVEIIIKLPDDSYDALVSFVFNVGAQAFRSPKTGKKTNFAKALEGGRFEEVDDRMRDWIYAGGRRVSGLINRRAAEATKWNFGFKYGANPASDIAVEDVVPTQAQPLPEETGVVPDPPVREPILPVKQVIAIGTTALGAVSTVAPEVVVNAGTQMRSLLPDIPVFNIVGGVLIAAGIGLTLYHGMRKSAQTGA